MAAPNSQPCGSRPGPAEPKTHQPFESGKPPTSDEAAGPLGQGVAPHGTPKPVGDGKKNPLH